MNPIHAAALHYHNEGLCVIPVIYRDKKPALVWERYHTRCSTTQEVESWFGNGHQYNIGIVHGEVSGNFVSIDIDHASGAIAQLGADFPELLKGRVEQSGSGSGYHIPLRLKTLPDFGDKQGKPRGNKTWKTTFGLFNIRARFCQTVVPPSLHPSGQRYKFLQKGQITEQDNLTALMEWLDKCAIKPKIERKKAIPKPTKPTQQSNLLDAVRVAWPDVITVFEEFGIANELLPEKRGELRILGNGGLLITDDRQRWFCFSDEVGGDVIEAWGWCKYGTEYDNRRQFRGVLLDMAKAAGIDIAHFYKQGDEINIEPTHTVQRDYWASQFVGYWERVR